MNISKVILGAMATLSPWASYASGSEAQQVDLGDMKVVGVSTVKAEPKKTPAHQVGGKSEYDCLYEYKISVGLGETYTTALQIGENISKFSDYAAYCVDSISGLDVVDDAELMAAQKRAMSSVYYFDAAVWQNLPEGEMTVVQDVVPIIMGYTEPMGQIEWTLLEENSDTICGYQCGKATANYGGRQWTAWYAPDIPVSTGPWKLQGLPGLILAAKDSEGLHSFSAISIRNGGTPIMLPEKTAVHYSTRDKVIKRKAEMEAKGLEGVDPSMIEEITVMKGSNDGRGNIIINGVPIRERPNGYSPLETE